MVIIFVENQQITESKSQLSGILKNEFDNSVHIFSFNKEWKIHCL